MAALRLHYRSPHAADIAGAILSPQAFESAARAIRDWPGYAPTPLRDLRRLAAELGVARIAYKDEGTRFGLGSFKALGGAYAVEHLVTKTDPAWRAELTVATATDGNHGRAVAWGARRLGCKAVVYLHAGVSASREEAIAALGARIVRTMGDYDDSVRQCAAEAAREGWNVISDTSWAGYEETPKTVMAGYGLMAEEALETFGAPAPTHLFVQAGVGALAAAVAGLMIHRFGENRPRFAVVEPEGAACLYESALQGRLSPARGATHTVMAGLECGEASPLAWAILDAASDAFMTVSDDEAIAAMRRLANPIQPDPAIQAGESAGVGLCGLIAACQDVTWREALGLEETSRILLFGTEGPTDPQLFETLTGQKAQTG